MKRVLAIGDFHCGHCVGLTPPEWDTDRPKPYLAKSYSMRRRVWDEFEKAVDALKPIDICIANGDLIDGKGPKTGGREQIVMSVLDQDQMAVDVLKFVEAETVCMSYGTGFHVGNDEDYEKVIADRIGALKIGSRDDIDVEGTIINYRHHIGGSTVPHGRHTPLAREQVWNQLWADRGEYPLAHVILRSHVHYHTFAGGPEWLAMTLPALQGYGSIYGARRMSGLVDIGIVAFDVFGPNEYFWRPILFRMPKSEAMEV